MGTHVIRMPDIGEGIAQVELVEWFVKVGDRVGEDQILADVMTDKATVEIPSAVAGTVISLGAAPGEVMAVGAELICIELDAEGEAAASAAPASPRPTSAAAPVVMQPVAEPTATPAPSSSVRRPLAAPAVRKRAWDAGIELRFVTGTGRQGRVTQDDLEQFLQRSAPASLNVGHDSAEPEQIPVIGLRRQIAQRMQDATRTVAHFSYVEEIDVTALEALRRHLNNKWTESRGRLTLLPLLVRALVVALREFPQLNAHYDDQAQMITRHHAVHVGIATQSDTGLMVPVLRDAHRGDLWANAAEIVRLAEAARNGTARRDELNGSTITLTSLGALGGIASTPVINRPEVAIIGVNRIVERPVVVNGQIVVRSMMNLSSSFDHRVVDGMDAARFIQAVRGLLEQPAMLFLD
ncbi:dihydrolipoamide acetyltransferase family protein [Pseudomonas sp. dw_358]|uniref:dihydrolipoamide acetyltransferase family protein n=1 Tax=Pseudomonas sp. dw_358 TaxID=2720083 RepID=UPI001BD5C8A5|nr:dihydrolipoamide acetyltransferase family protein [Pseudomonas sp. dw_358]